MEQTKIWYTSRTLWVNFISLLAVIANVLGVVQLPIDADVQVMALAIINAILRFNTSKAVKFE